jgi:hypothetical protein
MIIARAPASSGGKGVLEISMGSVHKSGMVAGRAAIGSPGAQRGRVVEMRLWGKLMGALLLWVKRIPRCVSVLILHQGLHKLHKTHSTTTSAISAPSRLSTRTA